MRTILGVTLMAVTALSFQGIGCSGTESNPSTSSTSTSGGTGGEGGAACVPEEEICDTLDNDCDGEVDEDCECLTGDTQDCYTGPDGTQNVGVCAMGTQSCDTATNTFGACEGEVIPAATDDCNGLDDNCDGQIDEGIADLVCGVGACMVVTPGCANGMTGTCVPGMPSLEVCDGADNDCDQLTDESFPGGGDTCDSGIPGVCAAGTMQCVADAPTCVPDLMATPEVCDDLDNDCNGAVDDNLPGTGTACSTGFPGVCSAGTVSCQNSTIDCFPIVSASPELCDGLDNDCNGQTDEGNPEGGGACDSGQPGACQAGTEMCMGGAIQCVPNNLGSAETCDGIDNNCDGQADEGDPGGGLACGCGGTTACVSGAVACQGGPTVYFSEDFANNNQGWTMDPNWQIGSATTSSGQNYGSPDPAQDHTPTADNGVGGVVIGGNAPITVHPYYYLTSPAFNTSGAPTVIFAYWRWLNSDYTPYMQNDIEVWNGTAWVTVFATAGTGTTSSSWTKFTYDLSAYANAAMRIRFGYLIGTTSGTYTVSSWNVDDVLVSSVACP